MPILPNHPLLTACSLLEIRQASDYRLDGETRLILFLDFDGVLHPLLASPSEQFCCMPRLESVLRDFPEILVVVASTWRLTRSLNQLRDLFPVEIRERVVGLTPHDDYPDRPGCREREALAWLEGYDSKAQWLALDDYAPAYFSLWRLVLCHDGFGHLEELELRERLSEMHRGKANTSMTVPPEANSKSKH